MFHFRRPFSCAETPSETGKKERKPAARKVRPPGHHLGPRGPVNNHDTDIDDEHGSQGFCLLNNVAVAAAYARCVHRKVVRAAAATETTPLQSPSNLSTSQMFWMFSSVTSQQQKRNCEETTILRLLRFAVQPVARGGEKEEQNTSNCAVGQKSRDCRFRRAPRKRCAVFAAELGWSPRSEIRLFHKKECAPAANGFAEESLYS